MVQYYDKVGKIICQECGRSYDVILPTHLKKTHDMTMNEYKEKYPDYPLASKSFGSKQRYKNTVKAMKEGDIGQEIQIEELNNFDLDKIPPVNVEKSVSTFIDEINDFSKSFEEKITEQKFNDPNIHKEKLIILNFLAKYFHDLQNSYFIEKINLSGMLEFRLISDICSPSNKLNFEFPNTFWHNHDVPKQSRDLILQQDGWKIIDVPGTKPSSSTILELLKKNNLI